MNRKRITSTLLGFAALSIIVAPFIIAAVVLGIQSFTVLLCLIGIAFLIMGASFSVGEMIRDIRREKDEWEKDD